MPTYEYECTNCGYKFEKKQPINDEPLKKCPKCQGEVKRLISGGTGFILKGSNTNQRHKNKNTCKFESTGTTCCGQKEPCNRRPCGD